VPEAFEDGEALWESGLRAQLEEVVAKRLHDPCLPGERAWVKVKNRASWRYELERERAIRAARPRSVGQERDCCWVVGFTRVLRA
jgi:hypothetical protein